MIVLDAHRRHVELVTPSQCARLVLDVFALPMDEERLATESVQVESESRKIKSLCGRVGGFRRTFTGVAMGGADDAKAIWVRRDGAVLTHATSAMLSEEGAHDRVRLDSNAGGLIASLTSVSKFLSLFDVPPPWYACFSILNCNGRQPSVRMAIYEGPIQEARLEFPPILLGPSNEETMTWEVKLWLDRLWNAVGAPECPLYDVERQRLNWNYVTQLYGAG